MHCRLTQRCDRRLMDFDEHDRQIADLGDSVLNTLAMRLPISVGRSQTANFTLLALDCRSWPMTEVADICRRLVKPKVVPHRCNSMSLLSRAARERSQGDDAEE